MNSDIESSCVQEFYQLCLTSKDDCRNHEENQNRIAQLADFIILQEKRVEIVRDCLEQVAEMIPLEIVWIFQEKGLLHFPAYLSLNPDFVPEISDGVLNLIFSRKFYIVASILASTLVASLHIQREIHYPAQYLLDSVSQSFVDRILKDEKDSDDTIGREFIRQLVTAPGVFVPALKTFITQLLRLVLSYEGDENSVVNVDDAISVQLKSWTLNKTPEHIVDFIKQILICLDPEEVIKELYNLVLNSDSKQFNWRWILVTISVLIVSLPHSAEFIKKSLDTWLVDSLNAKDANKLGAVVLITRQCYTEQIKPFSSYTVWFSTLNSIITSPSAFTFFFEFLSHLVPYEPTLYLKIHINKVPAVPQGVHAALSDYIALAKTRLADLRETTDYVGLFGEFSSTEQEGRESDVARVLSHFEDTGDVMRTVVEASVFRRDYYERVFLRELLKTTEPNTTRSKFIEKLFAIGKCPCAMYTDWSKRMNSKG